MRRRFCVNWQIAALRYFLLTNYVAIPVAWRLRDGGRHSRFAKSPGGRPAPISFAEAGLSSLSLRTRGVSPPKGWLCDALNVGPRKRSLELAVARDQLTLEPTKVIASPSTTPRNSLPLFTTTKCAAIIPLKIPDAVQFELTV